MSPHLPQRWRPHSARGSSSNSYTQDRRGTCSRPPRQSRASRRSARCALPTSGGREGWQGVLECVSARFGRVVASGRKSRKRTCVARTHGAFIWSASRSAAPRAREPTPRPWHDGCTAMRSSRIAVPARDPSTSRSFCSNHTFDWYKRYSVPASYENTAGSMKRRTSQSDGSGTVGLANIKNATSCSSPPSSRASNVALHASVESTRSIKLRANSQRRNFVRCSFAPGAIVT